MALCIICVFYELFLKWNSSWVFFNKSKSNTHFKVLCVINSIKETLWIAFKYFLQWFGKSLFLCSSLVLHLVVSFFLPREADGVFPLEPWLCRVSLGGHQRALAEQLCCTRGARDVFGHSWRDRPWGDVASPQPGEPWLPCPALPFLREHGRTHCSAIFQRHISASTGTSVTQCQGSALDSLWGYGAKGCWGPLPLCLEGELLGQLLHFMLVF